MRGKIWRKNISQTTEAVHQCNRALQFHRPFDLISTDLSGSKFINVPEMATESDTQNVPVLVKNTIVVVRHDKNEK